MRWRFSDKSRFQQEITAIYPSTLRMTCAVLIIVIFCSSRAHGWPGGNWRFWSKPFLIVHNATIIIGTIFVLNFHILMTQFPGLCICLVFQFLLRQRFNNPLCLYRYRSVGNSSLFLYCSTLSGQFASYCSICDNRCVPHNGWTVDIYDLFSY